MEKDISIPKKEVAEEASGVVHDIPGEPGREGRRTEPPALSVPRDIYGANDLVLLQNTSPPGGTYVHSLSAIDELLERDKLREKTASPAKFASEGW